MLTCGEQLLQTLTKPKKGFVKKLEKAEKAAQKKAKGGAAEDHEG